MSEDGKVCSCLEQVTLRIIEDHRPLVDDMVSTGQELIEMCSNEAGQGVQDDVDHIASKYDSVKHSIRDKLHQLNGALRGNATDVSSLHKEREIWLPLVWLLQSLQYVLKFISFCFYYYYLDLTIGFCILFIQ